MQNNSNKKFQNIKEIIGEEKQAKIKALEEESQDILVRLKKE